MFETIVFILMSGWIVYVSRGPLRSPGSHGFYRFFAWEFLLALFCQNMSYWFVNPFAPHQIVAWTLLVISLLLVVPGIAMLRRGKADDNRQDATLLGLEKTTELVTHGVYAFIRHPLYSSLLFLGWGIFFKNPSWVGVVLALAASIFLWLTARVEENENIRYFGAEYQEYMRHTKRFIPFII